MNAPTKPGDAADVLHGAAIIEAVKAAGVSHVLSVPDLHTAKGLLSPITADPDMTLIRTCKEDETLGIAAGLTYGAKRALILIQYTGFLYAMNAIRAVACEHKQPMCMMIGLLSKEPGVPPQESKRFGLRIIAGHEQHRCPTPLRPAHRRADPRRHGHRAALHRYRCRHRKDHAGDPPRL